MKTHAAAHPPASDHGRDCEVPRSGTIGGRSAPLGAAALVAGLALAVRLVYLAETSSVPFVRHLVGDAAGYWAWAEGLAAGDWLGDTAFYQAPLYPYVLGGIMAAGGTSVAALRIVQAAWGAVAVGCLCLGTTRWLGRGVGVAAGVMLALYPPALFFDGVIQKASLGCLLTCVLLLLLSSSLVGKARATAIGMVTGLLMLTRENAAAWVPVLLVWLGLVAGRSGKWGRSNAVIMSAVGMALVLAPVGLRNWSVSGDWSVSTFQMGPNLYIGNRQGASGRYDPLVRGHETPRFERHDATRLAEEAMGRALTPQEVSDYWTARTLAEICDDPAGWLRLMGRKLAMVWNRYEVPDVESQQVYADESVLLRSLAKVWHFGVLCPLAAIGLMATWNQRRQLWVLYVMIATMALAVAFFYVMARYRFPLVPLVIPFAAAGLIDVWQSARGRTWRRFTPRLVAAAVVAILVNVPVHPERRLDALATMNVGVALAEQGDVVGAIRYFSSAVDSSPDSAEARNNLAQALAVEGRFAEAIPHYRATLELAPTLLGVDYNLAAALERIGRTHEALVHYTRALELDPSDAAALDAVRRLGGVR